VKPTKSLKMVGFA